MSKPSLSALIWSAEHQRYEWHISGQLHLWFAQQDTTVWQNWLNEQRSLTSFSFQGQAGRLRIVKEARPRGGAYWYAYSTHGRKANKRYLGQSDRLAFVRLEEEARAIAIEKPLSPQAQYVSGQEARFASPNTLLEKRNGSHIPLLETRLTPPRFPSSLVTRDRLLRAFDALQDHRVLLLSASAGSGKTLLLSAWAATMPNGIAWVSLDELDNDPGRFWASIIMALRHSGIDLANVGDIAVAMLQAPQPPGLSTILTTLINDLLVISRETILVLDDYHVIEDQTIHKSLIFFVDHLPDNLHLVLSSRIDPDLPLARWRMRGQMAEIRDSDLRFTREETASFLLQVMGLSLAEADIEMLLQRTEGWIAGLQLAALSLRKSGDQAAFVQAISGSHRYLLDYMQQEILANLPRSLQDFLLQTAILSRLSAPLCQIVTEAPTIQASQEMLETLERANLFLTPLDEDRLWYRFHDLFREGLLTRLRATHPTLIPHLHLRAARWYERQAETREAIAHALAASDFAYATLMMERIAEELWLNGEMKTLYRWIMALPALVVREHARLVLTSALYLLNSIALSVGTERTQGRKEAEQLMARVEAAWKQPHGDARTALSGTEAMPDAEEAALLRQRLRLLHLWIAAFEATWRGDVDQLSSIVEEMQLMQRNDEIVWEMVPLSTTFILRYSFLQEGTLLVSLLQAAKQRALVTGDRYATLKIMQWLTLSHLSVGQLRLVQQEAMAAIDLIEQAAGHTLLKGYFYFCLENSFYQQNQLEEARTILRKMLDDAAPRQQIDLLIIGYCNLVEIEVASGDLCAALDAMKQVDVWLQHLKGTYHASLATSVRVHYWLAAGNLAAAANWAADMSFSQETWSPHQPEVFLMFARVQLAQQRYKEAIDLLERFSAFLERPGSSFTTIEFLAVYAVALYQGEKSAQAVAVAARLSTLTEPEGYIRVYLNAGEPMRQVLTMLIKSARLAGSLAKVAHQEKKATFQIGSISYISMLLAAFENEKRGPALLEPPHTANISQVATIEHRPISSGLIEPLTAREREVLQLLAAGTSNQDIANQLVISLTTVKKHVGSLLAKLMAENRTHAVARARELSLL